MSAPHRPHFSSRIASVLTLIGVAVGLGNVWRFPYMMGKYGGSAFLFMYLGFSLVFAIPALMGEIALGRATGKGPIGAFRAALGPKAGKWIGYLLLLTIAVSSSYYVVVIANVLFSSFFSIVRGFHPASFPIFEAQLNTGGIQYGIVCITMVAASWILLKGLHKGIESASKLLVPFFLLTIVYLIFHVFSLEGVGTHIYQFLRPDFQALKPQYIFAALGQSFFSLSLGGTFMLVYGSYLPPTESISKISLFTGLGDVGAALLTGLFIVPAILVFGLDMQAGPGLIFSTLPKLFSEIPAGQWVGSFFLVALAMVALLSLVAALEVIVDSLAELGIFQGSRERVILFVAVLELLLAFPSAFDPALIGTLDLVFGSGMQVTGCGLALIALTWGLGKSATLTQIFPGEATGQRGLFFVWIKWCIPIVLLWVLMGYIYSSIL